jgi:hypothetical protein
MQKRLKNCPDHNVCVQVRFKIVIFPSDADDDRSGPKDKHLRKKTKRSEFSLLRWL